MFRMTATCFVILALLGLAVDSAIAGPACSSCAGGSRVNAKQAVRIGGPYALLVDPLGSSLVDVAKPIIIVHDGRELRFANGENLKKFQAAPDKYLAEVDAKIIAQQKPQYPLDTCVVSGEKLGSMGDPIDIVYGNRLVRFCCEGCIGGFKKNPAKYLAKIDTAVIEAQKDDYPMNACVVSGEEMGGEMGEPIDYVIGSRLVRFCCKSCVKMFEKNPAKYLAEIDGHKKQKDASHDEGNGGGHGERDHNH